MDFDRFGARYNDHVNDALAFSGTEQEFYLRAKANEVERLVTEHLSSISSPALLDVGCGIGLVHEMLGERYPGLVGVDVAPATLAEAQRRQPSARFAQYDGHSLPFDDGEFDSMVLIPVLQ